MEVRFCIKNTQIKFHKHNIGLKEIFSIYKASRSNILTAGPIVQEFELAFAEYLNVKYVVGTSSCTAAIHLALQASEIGPGDEVIVPNITFAATALAVIHSGATPVLVDVDPYTGLILPQNILSAISRKTKAVIAVHLYGQVCDLTAINKVCKDQKILFFEDAAHCIEGSLGGAKPGTISDGAFFSFYPTKSITSGEGGAFATNNKMLSEKVKLLRTHGLTKTASDRAIEGFRFWDIEEVGWKYNLNDLQASMLIPQLKTLKSRHEKRLRIAAEYHKRLNSNHVKLPNNLNVNHAAHIYSIQVDPTKRDGLIQHLNNLGIGCSVHYLPLHRITALRFAARNELDLSNSISIGRQIISLPIYPKLKVAEIKKICETINEFLEV